MKRNNWFFGTVPYSTLRVLCRGLFPAMPTPYIGSKKRKNIAPPYQQLIL